MGMGMVLDFGTHGTPCTCTRCCGHSTGKLQWVIFTIHYFYSHFSPFSFSTAMALVLWQFWECLVINTIIIFYISCTATYIYSIYFRVHNCLFPWFFYFPMVMWHGKSHDHINLWTYTFVSSSQPHHHSNMTKIVVLHMPHNWAISIWQCASQLSVPEFTLLWFL